ncbi:plasmid replication initiator [Acetobacter sacchari]|uniref:Plasmid replication initiator n=1 Tax=Acetobacter sacchari TaxID=2661687 RepID=A0ABS3LWH0_9PROT|nr:replication protein RepA [Acetobacter sacchari]MBO1360259.1 plasmid replication initiator [Acetobacter sacchari]
MGEIHRVIESNGAQGALSFDFDRKVVEVAAGYMANEDASIGFLYSGFTHVGLPHRRLDDDAAWQVETDRAMMVVEPGRRGIPGGQPIFVGVPYGSKARLIMLYLQTAAIKTSSREVELGKNLHQWLKKMGLSVGGKTVHDVREQAERISRCRINFEFRSSGATGLINQNIVDNAMFIDDDNSGRTQFLEKVMLSEVFYSQLLKHPVPIEEAAIRALNGHSQALDIYCWLSYRLHVLKAPTPISWVALKAQFGTGVAQMKHFKAKFVDNLKLALAVYPAAAVDLTPAGMILHPSRAPISPKIIQFPSLGR